MRTQGTIAFAIALWLTLATAWAMENPLRDPAQLRKPSREQAVAVASARVLVADYALLRRDFPVLQRMSDSSIDAWLISQIAFVTRAQAAQEVVNTRISRTGAAREMIRPYEYGRASVFEVPGGLIDIKGTGSRHPRAGSHRNGLATLGEAIREHVYSRLIEMILQHAGSRTQIVQTYGVIDWGFDVRQPDGSLSRAGAILRQAHRRSEGIVSILPGLKSLPIERVLRAYGVTSTGADRDRDAEEINIQASAEGALVDFGAYMTVRDFSRPVRNSYETPILLKPDNADFPHPIERFRVPFELWGTNGWDDPQGDNPWAWSHELAEAVRRGAAGREAMLEHMRNLLGPVREILTREPLDCESALLGG